jgi:N-acyl-D-amino-acid deacylase
VAIKNGHIEQLGKIDANRAKRFIDAKNQIVAPGFIDVHGHIEGGIEKLPLAENMLQMGVTSIITGNCGFSETSLKEWFGKLEKLGISMNASSNLVLRSRTFGNI